MLRLCVALLGLVAAPVSAQVTSLYPPGGTIWAQTAEVTLDGSGNATWVFDPNNPPPSSPSVTHMVKAMDMQNPIICNWSVRTTVSVSIHCWRTTLLGLFTNLYAGNVAGAQVTLDARVTQ